MRLGIILATIVALSGCAQAFDTYADAAIGANQAKRSFYNQIGYTAALEKMEAAGVRPSGGGAYPGVGYPADDPVRARMQYEQLRNQDLVMQHGAGGCAPDFVTGGCM